MSYSHSFLVFHISPPNLDQSLPLDWHCDCIEHPYVFIIIQSIDSPSFCQFSLCSACGKQNSKNLIKTYLWFWALERWLQGIIHMLWYLQFTGPLGCGDCFISKVKQYTAQLSLWQGTGFLPDFCLLFLSPSGTSHWNRTSKVFRALRVFRVLAALETAQVL